MYLNAQLIHALEPANRRGYSRKEAASYVGYSPGAFDKLVRLGFMPPPIVLLRRKTWDKNGLDAAIDLLSGRGNSSQAQQSDWDGLFQ